MALSPEWDYCRQPGWPSIGTKGACDLIRSRTGTILSSMAGSSWRFHNFLYSGERGHRLESGSWQDHLIYGEGDGRVNGGLYKDFWWGGEMGRRNPQSDVIHDDCRIEGCGIQTKCALKPALQRVQEKGSGTDPDESQNAIRHREQRESVECVSNLKDAQIGFLPFYVAP